jgi:hypothetical protein
MYFQKKLLFQIMTNFIIFVLLFFCISCSSYAKQMKVYSCDLIDDAESCSKNCRFDPETLYEFMVEKNNKIVLWKVFEKGRYVGSRTYDNCRIFDENNWDCSKDEGISRIIKKMTNGIYVNGFVSPKLRDTGFHTCSK